MTNIAADNKTLEQLIDDYSCETIATEAEGSDKNRVMVVIDALVKWFKQLMEYITKRFRALFSKFKRSTQTCKEVSEQIKQESKPPQTVEEKFGPVQDRTMNPKMYYFLKDGNSENRFKDLKRNIEKFLNEPQFRTTHQFIVKELGMVVNKLSHAPHADISDKYHTFIHGVNEKFEEMIGLFEERFSDYECPVLAGGAKVVSDNGNTFRFEMPDVDDSDSNHWVQEIDLSVFEYVANSPKHVNELEAAMDWLDEINHFGIEKVIAPLRGFKDILPPKNREVWQRHQDIQKEIRDLEKNYRKFVSACVSFYNAHATAYTAITEYVAALGIYYVK